MPVDVALPAINHAEWLPKVYAPQQQQTVKASAHYAAPLSVQFSWTVNWSVGGQISMRGSVNREKGEWRRTQCSLYLELIFFYFFIRSSNQCEMAKDSIGPTTYTTKCGRAFVHLKNSSYFSFSHFIYKKRFAENLFNLI